MLEAREVTDLGDQADGGQRVDAAQTPQPRDQGDQGAGVGLLVDQAARGDRAAPSSAS